MRRPGDDYFPEAIIGIGVIMAVVYFALWAIWRVL